MKLEDQVCSFEFAKKLKTSGVNQESAFYYEEWPSGPRFFIWQDDDVSMHPKFAAFTVAELGETFEPRLEVVSHKNSTLIDDKQYICFNLNQTDFYGFFSAKSEADARAKMLVYLLENKLTSVGGIK